MLFVWLFLQEFIDRFGECYLRNVFLTHRLQLQLTVQLNVFLSELLVLLLEHLNASIHMANFPAYLLEQNEEPIGFFLVLGNAPQQFVDNLLIALIHISLLLLEF